MALTFPANPTNGQIYDQYIYNATAQTWRVYGSDTGITNVLATKANLSGGNTFSGNQVFSNYVLQPNQPAFKAYGLNTTNSGSYCVFPTITLNVGSCYSASTGRFTAPVDGTYVFYYSQIGGNVDTVYRYYLRKNNAAQTPDYQLRLDTNATGVDYGDSGSHAAVIYLNANDYVSIFFESDNATASYGSGAPTNSYPTFSGYLIG